MGAIRSEAGRWLAALGLLLSAGAVQAQADQFYFVGKAGSAGAMSRAGQGQEAVYLRWGPVEGQLPADIARLVLERNGETLVDVAADAAPASAATIQGWYDQPENRQRKRAMVHWLNQLEGVDVGPAQLGQALRERIIKDPAFAGLASRQDILVARALHRGLVDGGFVERVDYQLFAISTGGEKRRLGVLNVNRDQDQPAPAPANLRQIHERRCDAPERAMDHGTVKLGWRHGGANATDRFAASLLVSGYDIYRTEKPIDPRSTPISLDLRKLASRVQSNSRGELVLPGLVRLNDSVVAAAGDGKHFTLDAPAVRKAGMRPGETYGVHVVPRDFAGQYGITTTDTFTVPDLLPPPAPWEVMAAESASSTEARLVWQDVNLRNYLEAWPARQACNLPEARTTLRLEVAGEGRSCGERPRRTVNVSSDDYRVYRFASYDVAERFTDADGDGFADFEERAAQSPGTACNPDKQTGTQSYRVDQNASVALREIANDDGTVRMQFDDPVPAGDTGNVYWYRIATLGDNGQASQLTPPVRMLVPDRTVPAPPSDADITFTHPPACRFNSEVFVEGSALSISLPAGKGYDLPASASVRCLDGRAIQNESLNKLSNLSNTVDGAVCTAIRSQCPGDTALFDIRDASGRSLTVAALRDAEEGCPNIISVTSDCTGTAQPVAPGDMLQLPPHLSVATNQCAVLYRRIDGKQQKVETRCDPGSGNVQFDFPVADHVPGEQACYSVAITNANAQQSASHDLNCFVMADQVVRPPAPTPVDMSFANAGAKLTWLAPEARAQGTIISYYPSDDPGQVTQKLVPAPQGVAAPSPQQQASIDLPALDDSEDGREWCFVARAVGVAPASRASEALSEASAPLCSRREVAEEELERIPWPGRAAPADLGTLPARYESVDELPLVRLSEKDETDVNNQVCDYTVPPCGDGASCLDDGQPREGFCDQSAAQLCHVLESTAAEELGFVAYRQSRRSGVSGPFVQVSPLVSRVHCEISRSDESTTNVNRHRDPYLSLFDFSNGGDWLGNRWVFKDQYPHEAGVDYRYQLVYFDSQGEITGYRTSNWVTAQ